MAEKVQSSREFRCRTCKSDAFQFPALLKHLTSAHGLRCPFKGTKTLTLHIDAAGASTSLYEWDLGAALIDETSVVATGRR